MIFLSLRTDKPEAEICLYQNSRQLACSTWQAHRELSDTIHLKLKEILELEKITLQQIDGIIIYKGPGSFTGLRIGFSVANALADSLKVNIVSETADKWQEAGIERLLANDNEMIALPNYGALPHITAPKK